MSLLRFLKKPGGGESSPLFPTPQSSAEKAANDEVASLLKKKKRNRPGIIVRAKIGWYAAEKMLFG